MTNVRYDVEADALYVELSPAKSVRTEELGEGRYVDYDDAGNVIGFELLAVSHYGVELKGVPRAVEIAAALNAIPHPANP